MNEAELIALAAAHGIALQPLAASCSGPQGGAAKRRDEVLAGVEVVPKGAARSMARPPLWAGPALAFKELPWHAARYSFASDCMSYWPLWHGLVFQVQRFGRREKWPARVRGARGELQFYLLELAALVLDEEASRPLFVAAPQLRPLYMQVEARTWDEVLAPRYGVLQATYRQWLAIGRGMIQRWVGEAEPQGICGELAKRIPPDPGTAGRKGIARQAPSPQSRKAARQRRRACIAR